MKRVFKFDFRIRGDYAEGKLPDGSIFYVDTNRIPDIEKLPWHRNKEGYVSNYLRSSKETLTLHRWLLGITDPTVIVDHINRVRMDCRLENLRTASFQQNSCNHKIFCTNQTGYAGVYYSNCSRRYEAKVGYKGKRIFLGASTDNPRHLAQFYNIAAQYLYGAYVGVLNDVPSPSLTDIQRIQDKCFHHKQWLDSREISP